jgi:putative addiction module killer protein
MYEIELTEDFSHWLNNLRDSKTKKIIIKRISNISIGLFGYTRSLSEGLFEARIRHASGYRLYFVNTGKKIIIMLCGGDKSTQRQDIIKAKKMAKEI